MRLEVQDWQSLPVEEFASHRPWPFQVVDNVDTLNRRVAREAVALIREAGQENRSVRIILPVGPLEYRYWADICNAERVSCAPLVLMGMDEYLDADTGGYLSRENPLSFRRFVEESLVQNLDPELRPDPANIHFPDPRDPSRTTALVESWGGADVCYGGMGITGHLAFNDPPEPGQSVDDKTFRNCRTRCLTVCRESQAQMCMGGTQGNWDILPPRAVTLGLYELLMSKRLHLTFMRSWHAGVLRRALFGPIGQACPGSFVQDHPQVEVTLTRLAAAPPLLNVAQATGEDV